MLNIGEKAPDFTLLDANNNFVSLKDFSGKKIILWFFPKANTPGWIIEGKGFRSEFQKFEEKNIQIIGCSADSPKKQNKFCDKQKFLYPMLCDEDHTMLESYGVWGIKKFMGREYLGISRITYIISEDGVIEKVYEKVNTKTHALDILNDLKELQWILEY